MSGGTGRVVVVGGGVIGAACAHYLNKAGWAVTVLERDEFGMGCSHANCGFVCPSHVLPLAAPGAVGMALRSLFQSDAPLRIKPRIDPALWAWLYRFARRCTVPHMLEAGRAVQALLNSSRRLYDELMREENIACEWETRGLLFVFHSPPAMEHYADTDRLLRQTFDLGARRFDGDALVQLEPALNPGLAGAWLYENDAHLRPDKLMSSWQRVLEARGVAVRTHCEMTGLLHEQGVVRAVATPQGEVRADAVVVAAGAWTPLLAEHLGCRVPIQPGKGYSITMPRPVLCPKYPMIFEEHRVAVTPMQSGYRIGSTMEFAGYDATLNRRRLDYLRQGSSHYLREPYRDPVEEEWFGWRPMTYDGKPIIDRSPALANVWIAAGHNMLGLSMAPATGKLLAELVGRHTPHVDPAPYSLSRF
jgi:D-amino-acid dehydrogenase